MSNRPLRLESRREQTRVVPAQVEIFDIEKIEEHFQENIHTVTSKFEIAAYLSSIGKLKETEDIWRTQIVFLESAFDFYMHEIVKLGVVSIFDGSWGENSKTDKYKKLKVNMVFVEKAVADTEDISWIKEWVTDIYSSITLMSFEKFKDVCNLLDLNINNIKTDSALSEELESFMSKLYSRRNSIAHQSDRKIENAEIQSISEEEVKSCIEGMNKIVKAIGKEIRRKSHR